MTAAFDQLAADNKALRDAVEARLAGRVVAAEAACCEGGRCHPEEVEEPTDLDEAESTIPSDWILRGEAELNAERGRVPVMPLGCGVINAVGETPAERLLLDALEAVRDRRGKYGPPQNHFAITVALVNAAFGTSFSESDWATIMVLDKIARSRGPMDCRDNDVDLAGYAACRAECRHRP